MNRLAPSILSADFSSLGQSVNIVEEAGAQILHMDVMDGHFVPNISYGAPVIKSLVGKTKLPFDIHLMIENPERYIEDFVTENTEIITVHYEACIHLNRTLQLIRSLGVKAGVSLNPSTSPQVLDYIIDDLDYILIMSVNPGFGGQSFIPSSLKKIQAVSKMKRDYNEGLTIAVDGGITLDNVGSVIEAGADFIVAGSSVFGAADISGRVKDFLDIMNK
jgi:ribulose-phosphate 3-epimerase